jgi:hypothetical protein
VDRMENAACASIRAGESWRGCNGVNEDVSGIARKKWRKSLLMVWNNKELINTFWPCDQCKTESVS